MPEATVSSLEVVIGIVLTWLAIGMAAVLRPGRTDIVTRFLYPLGLPDLPFHVRLDALASYFLVTTEHHVLQIRGRASSTC